MSYQLSTLTLLPTTLVSGVSTMDESALPLKSELTSRLASYAQNALELAFGGGLEGGVESFGGGGLLGDVGEVDDGDVGGGDADGEAVELAGGLRDDQLEGLGGAGRGGNHRQGGGAGAAQVLVREVEDDLVVGVAVDGGHDAADHAAVSPSRTLTTGARQLVVQLALEMMLCLAGSYLSSLTPRTMVSLRCLRERR